MVKLTVVADNGGDEQDKLLRRVKGLAPRVVLLVEQEMNTNTASFVARVGEATAYYTALLKSIGLIMARE
ncbi:hypothetical protein SLEP1_g37357 [Rubroshorea leprosula]|uniref:Uncharacterized protein n=1 Tax=Rubroshorea leprosula TaxID=152421 RepID=A0AAV5KUA6_9ROSI|nr:hypothetical protein SLEP1_g37357 [Rubroshorea leprosula]